MKIDGVTIFRLYCGTSCLVLLDLITTLMLEPLGGIELNPFVIWQWSLIGVENFVIKRIGLHLLFGCFIVLMSHILKSEEDKKAWSKSIMVILVGLLIWFSVVVMNHFLMILFAIST